MRLKKLTLALGAFIGTLIIAPSEAANIVYDNDAEGAGYQVTAEDRELLREVLGAAEKAEVSRNSSTPVESISAPVTVEPAAPQYAANSPEQAPLIENLSKTELMRRERMRVELKNEDVLQERLEALRLRDESRRTKQLLGVDDTTELDPSQPIRALQMEEQAVGTLASEQSSQSQMMTAQNGYQDQMMMSQASAAPVSVSLMEQPQERSTLSKIVISPRVGMSSISGMDYMDVRPRFSAGAALEFAATDSVSLEAGYTYSEYGVVPGPTDYGANYVKSFSPNSYYTADIETLSYKQNVFDLGLKVFLLNSSSRIRPFIGGGAAYSRGFANYDAQLREYARNYFGYDLGPDYSASSVLGQVSTGLDVALSKQLSVGAMFRYHTVMTSREKQDFAYSQFYTIGSEDKRAIGGSLARSSFYSVTGGVSFSF